MIPVLPFLALVAFARCGPVSPSENDVSVWKTVSECLESGHAVLCFKERALRITDRMRSMKQLSIVDGITLANAEPTRTARSADVTALEPTAREAQVEEGIVDNVGDILRSTVLQFRLPGAADPEDSSLEGRGKKKDQKKHLLITLILKAKLFLLVPIFLGIIAFFLLKSLILAKIAFIFAAITLLKKLLAKHHSAPAVWTAPPSHGWAPQAEPHGWENQGWDRSNKIVDAQSLAYSGQLKTQQHLST